MLAKVLFALLGLIALVVLVAWVALITGMPWFVALPFGWVCGSIYGSVMGMWIIKSL